MDTLFADPSIGITELKKTPSAVVVEAGGAPGVIRYHRPLGYLVSACRDEVVMAVRVDLVEAAMVDAIEDAARDRR